jgi:hypothetical protein
MAYVHVPRALVPSAVTLAFFGAWVVSTYFPIPSYDWSTEGIAAPPEAVTVTVKVRGLKCRHASEGMHGLLFDREDALAPQGYLRAVIYPSPGAGDMILTYDPAQTNLQKLARAVKLDADGQETEFRMLLEVKPDLSSPASLLREIAKSFEAQHEELFAACHVGGHGARFEALVDAWGELFFEGLAVLKGPDAEGWIELAGISVGDQISLADYGVEMTRLRVAKTDKGWQVAEADWSGFRSQGF